MKLRTNKRLASEAKKSSSRGVYNGRIQQEGTKTKTGFSGGGGIVKSIRKTNRSGYQRSELIKATSSTVSQTRSPSTGDTQFLSTGTNNSVGSLATAQTRVITRRSTIKKNVVLVAEVNLQENSRGATRVLRSRNLNCSLGGESKSVLKTAEGSPDATRASRQRLNLRVTRSSSPTATSSLTEACIASPESVAFEGAKKVHFKTTVSLPQESSVSVAKRPGTGFTSKLRQKKKRRRRRKRSIQSVKSRRASGSTVPILKQDSSCSETPNTMHEDVAPSAVGSTVGECSVDAPNKEVVDSGASNRQSLEQDPEVDNADSNSDSSGNSNTSNSNNGEKDTDAEGTTLSQITFEESTNESTSSSFLDDYTSHMDYSAEEDLSLFRDEYCPNGVSPAGNSNPFGLSSIAPLPLPSTNNGQNMAASGSSSEASATSTSAEELFSCTFPSSSSWFSQTAPSHLNSLPYNDNTSSMFYQDSSGANCVPNSSLCKTSGPASAGSTATSEYNSMMPCSSSSANALTSSALWAAASSSNWCGSSTNANPESMTDDESRGSWSHILEMSASNEGDSNDKDNSTVSQYNDHNMHFGVPSSASSQQMIQNPQHDYSQQLLYSHNSVNNGYGQGSNMDNTLITSCSPTNTSMMTMPSPNYTYYTSKINHLLCLFKVHIISPAITIVHLNVFGRYEICCNNGPSLLHLQKKLSVCLNNENRTCYMLYQMATAKSIMMNTGKIQTRMRLSKTCLH